MKKINKIGIINTDVIGDKIAILIKSMRILAVETSCDETSIAVMQFDAGGSFKLLSNIVSSQVKTHAPYGGVVPILAKREHQKNLTLILKKSLTETGLLKNQKSKIKNQNDNSKFKNLREIFDREEVLYKNLLPFLKKYKKPKINLIAVTNGPGLEPALWVGVNFAKALGYFWNLPVMPVNHVEAHITANWLTPIRGISNFQFPISNKNLKSKFLNPKSAFPAISLIVSGGHTQLVLMRDFGQYEILGETRDDAAGEAFDKLAKMLNLGYPGGPIVAKIAQAIDVGRRYRSIDVRRHVVLPRPMLNSKDYDFSFSGLKTAALYFVKTLDKKTIKKLTPAICAEFQQAVVDVLVKKAMCAAKEFKAKTVLLSGGVASNDLLRTTLEKESISRGFSFSVPPKEFCTDNAAMIALTAAMKIQKSKIKMQNYNVKFKNLNWRKIKVDANLRIS